MKAKAIEGDFPITMACPEERVVWVGKRCWVAMNITERHFMGIPYTVWGGSPQDWGTGRGYVVCCRGSFRAAMRVVKQLG